MIKDISGTKFNNIFVLESLPPGDLRAGENLVYDTLQPICENGRKFGLGFWKLETLDALKRALAEIATKCKRESSPIYPILHLDMHGAKDSGLWIAESDEFMEWAEFTEYCRNINVECQNNLLVTMGACFGYYAIQNVSINEITPFFALIGPVRIVKVGNVDSEFPEFFRKLFSTGDVMCALTTLGSEYRLYHCEALFVRCYAKYYRTGAMGKGLRQRKERLLSRILETLETKGKNITIVRRILKSKMKFAPGYYKLKNNFLMANHPSNSDRFKLNFGEVKQLARKIDM